jgi:hypothetical protein
MGLLLLQSPSSARSFWNAAGQVLGWEGLSFIVLCPLAMGFIAMAKYRAARIFFALSAVMLVVKTVSAAHAYFPDRWVPVGEFYAVSASILFLIWMLIWVDAEEQKTNPERADIHATLVIDSVENETVQYHLEIENGPIRIRDIKTRVKTPHFSGSEIMTPMPRLLVANAKLSVLGPPAVIRPGSYNNLLVNVAYNATVHHEEKQLWSTFQFLIGPDVKPGTVNPEGVNSGEGHLAFEEDAKNIEFPARFAEPVGGFAVVLPEVSPNGKPNICSISNEHRAFLFDPEARVVIFEIKIGDWYAALSLKLEDTSSVHVVMIQWNSTGALLKVDGNEACTPNFSGD